MKPEDAKSRDYAFRADDAMALHAVIFRLLRCRKQVYVFIPLGLKTLNSGIPVTGEFSPPSSYRVMNKSLYLICYINTIQNKRLRGFDAPLYQMKPA